MSLHRSGGDSSGKKYLPYVDFEERVYTRTCEKGSILYQFQTAEGKVGKFFIESTNISPEQVGLLSKDYPKLLKIELKEDITVFVTQHIKKKPYWRDGKTVTEGGARSCLQPI